MQVLQCISMSCCLVPVSTAVCMHGTAVRLVSWLSYTKLPVSFRQHLSAYDRDAGLCELADSCAPSLH